MVCQTSQRDHVAGAAFSNGDKSMRHSSLLGAGLLLVVISTSGALAQNDRPDIALSTSSYGAISCGKFLDMGPGDRDAIVRKMTAEAPASSLSQDVPSGVTLSGALVQAQDERNLPPLDSGRLVSACQATNAISTLREAYAHSNPAPEVYAPLSN
jgi:hypothetical protein